MYKKTILIVGIFIIVSLFFFACEDVVESMSVQERVDNFLSDLNNDAERDDIYTNLTSDLQSWANPTAWNNMYFDYVRIPFSISINNYGTSSASGTITSSWDASGSQIDFFLTDVDGNYKINRIQINGSNVIY